MRASMRLAQCCVGIRYTIERLALQDEGLRRRLRSLGVAEGSGIRLLQKYPAYVVACEGTQLALDVRLAEKIWVVK